MKWNAVLRSTGTALVAAFLCACQSAAGALGEPPEGTAMWSGTWDSDTYGGVHGDAAALLPDPLPEGDFEAPAAIHYAFFSLYRPNRVVRTRFAGRMRPGGESGGTNLGDPITRAAFLITLKGGFGNSPQLLEYHGTLDEARTRMRGEYRSVSPYDEGTFELERTPGP